VGLSGIGSVVEFSVTSCSCLTLSRCYVVAQCRSGVCGHVRWLLTETLCEAGRCGMSRRGLHDARAVLLDRSRGDAGENGSQDPWSGCLFGVDCARNRLCLPGRAGDPFSDADHIERTGREREAGQATSILPWAASPLHRTRVLPVSAASLCPSFAESSRENVCEIALSGASVRPVPGTACVCELGLCGALADA
jgi:hypothetical protein